MKCSANLSSILTFYISDEFLPPRAAPVPNVRAFKIEKSAAAEGSYSQNSITTN